MGEERGERERGEGEGRGERGEGREMRKSLAPHS